MSSAARDRFLELLGTTVRGGALVKLTLGKHRGPDATVRNLFIRPVALRAGPHLAFVWRHATRDITKNLGIEPGLAEIERLLGGAFLDAHLFTRGEVAQFETKPDGTARLKLGSTGPAAVTSPPAHDRLKQHPIPADASWLRALGVTNERNRPREGMADKFRQIQKFAELLSHLVAEAFPPGATPPGTIPTAPSPATSGSDDSGDPGSAAAPAAPLRIVDMGSGKGYLTFAVAELLGERATVRGIEARPELVTLCNQVAAQHGLAPRLSFASGSIAETPLAGCDILIALHACDTATDDALARGIAAGAKLLVVAPCCQKELRPQLRAPAVLAPALRHGIFQERQAEFVTDALRGQLLEWAGYRTKVFEFVSTEHTAKNLMISAVKVRPAGNAEDPIADRARELAAFYGIRTQRLAQHLGLTLVPPRNFVPEIPA